MYCRVYAWKVGGISFENKVCNIVNKLRKKPKQKQKKKQKNEKRCQKVLIMCAEFKPSSWLRSLQDIQKKTKQRRDVDI